MRKIEIRPQAGPQEEFLRSTADIAVYGGAAGGGKTWAMLVEPLRHINNSGFNAMIFRKQLIQVVSPGGLWDESEKIYRHYPLRGRSNLADLHWRFPSGALIRFSYLNSEADVYKWQGSQICLLCFDELTHFSKSQFLYMLSRNRSLCGVRPYVRATCNPEAESWVADLIGWWIDPKLGTPIPERSGKIRYMINLEGVFRWGNSPEELQAEYGSELIPKSVTFIGASLFDNKILMEHNPEYLSNLMALPLVERERLLRGNWVIRPSSGLYFKREWVNVVDEPPADLDVIRYWDLAATEKTTDNDPDFTAAIKLGIAKNGHIYVMHGLAFRASPLKVEQAIQNIASQDGKKVIIGIPQDPGQAGKSQIRTYAKLLAGYNMRSRAESGDKVTRFGPFSAQCEAGNVSFVRGDWNEEFFGVLEAFPESRHDDHVDACSGAYNMLSEILEKRFTKWSASPDWL